MNKVLEVITNDKAGNEFTAESFLDNLRPSNDLWYEEKELVVNDWIFRGHWNGEWDLIPSAYRDNNKLHAIIEKIKDFPIDNIKPKPTSKERDYYILLNAERQSVYDFCQLAESLGFPIEQFEVYTSLQWKKILVFLSGEGIDFTNLLTAQHYGIPTRLLDWTSNPLTACYFSVGREFRTKENPDFISVWALNTKHSSQLDFKYLDSSFSINYMRQYNFQNKFSHSQHGVATHISATSDGLKNFFVENDRPINMNDLIEQGRLIYKTTPTLFKEFRLKIKEADRLLLLLDREGISKAALMPELSNVSDTVISRWNY